MKNVVFSVSNSTGIETVKDSGVTVNGSVVYDLQGCRLAQPVKGINIVNGKKIVR
jgi:hypothetical protein